MYTSVVIAEESTEEAYFFSYKRFFVNRQVLQALPAGGKFKQEVLSFVKYFDKGVYAFSSGNLKTAEENLKTARKVWPEYYGTDFMLALVYEEYGDEKTAARYYKGYLNKLKEVHAGKYPISAPLILGFTSFEVEDYATAYDQTKRHLAERGMDIDRVRPVINVPEFIFPLLWMFLFAGVLIAWKYRIAPLIKRQRHLMNPPEGFWVCRNCGEDNPEPAKECIRCRMPRK